MGILSHFGDKSSIKALEKLIKNEAKATAKMSASKDFAKMASKAGADDIAKELGKAGKFKGMENKWAQEAEELWAKEHEGKTFKKYMDELGDSSIYKELSDQEKELIKNNDFTEDQIMKGKKRILKADKRRIQAEHDSFIRDQVDEKMSQMKSDQKDFNKTINKYADKKENGEKLNKLNRRRTSVDKINNMSDEEYADFINENAPDSLKGMLSSKDNFNKVNKAYERGTLKGAAIKGSLIAGSAGAVIGSGTGTTDDDRKAAAVTGAGLGVGAGAVGGLGVAMLARSLARGGR